MTVELDRERARVLNGLVFLYIFSTMVFPAVPLLSRLSLLFAIGLGVVIIIRYLQDRPLMVSPWMVLPLLFMIYALASIWWSTDPQVALQSSISLVSTIVGALLLWLALLSGASWSAVVAGSLWSGIVIIASTLPEMSEAGTNMRLAGILGNPNAMAIHLTTVAFVLMAAPRRQWQLGACAVGFILFATIFSGSIKMLLFWIVFLGYAAFQLHRWSARSYLNKALLMGLYFLLITIPLVIGSLLIDNLESMTVSKRFVALLEGENTSGTTRLDMLQQALGLWMEKPMFGHGIDQFRVLGSYGTYSHNNYVEMLADFGVLGTTLFYLTNVIILVLCVKGIFSDNKLYRLVFIITIASLLWDVGLVSYVEKSAWITTTLSFYLLQRAEREGQQCFVRTDNLSMGVARNARSKTSGAYRP